MTTRFTRKRLLGSSSWNDRVKVRSRDWLVTITRSGQRQSFRTVQLRGSSLKIWWSGLDICGITGELSIWEMWLQKDSVSDIRHERSDSNPQKIWISEDSINRRRHQSFCGSELVKKMGTTENVRIDLKEWNREAGYVRAWNDQTFVFWSVDSVTDAVEDITSRERWRHDK